MSAMISSERTKGGPPESLVVSDDRGLYYAETANFASDKTPILPKNADDRKVT